MRFCRSINCSCSVSTCCLRSRSCEREEVGDALRGLVAGLQIALDELVDEPVDDVGGELGIKSLAADLNEVCLGNDVDADVAVHAVQGALANVQIIEAEMPVRTVVAGEGGIVGQVEVTGYGQQNRIALNNGDLRLTAKSLPSRNLALPLTRNWLDEPLRISMVPVA